MQDDFQVMVSEFRREMTGLKFQSNFYNPMQINKVKRENKMHGFSSCILLRRNLIPIFCESLSIYVCVCKVRELWWSNILDVFFKVLRWLLNGLCALQRWWFRDCSICGVAFNLVAQTVPGEEKLPSEVLRMEFNSLLPATQSSQYPNSPYSRTI